MRLVLKLLWEQFFSEEFQTFPFDHQVIVKPAIMLVEAPVEFHEQTVHMELHTLRDMVAVFLLPRTWKFADGKGYVVNSSTNGIDDYQLATSRTAAPTRDRIVPREFHSRFSATPNHRSEHTLVLVQDRRRGLSTVGMMHWIVAELWTLFLNLRSEGKSEEAQVKSSKDGHSHTAVLAFPRCPQQGPAANCRNQGITQVCALSSPFFGSMSVIAMLRQPSGQRCLDGKQSDMPWTGAC